MAKTEDNAFADLFGAFGRELKLPKVDVESILDHHRENLEALQKSASASASGATSILSRQREMIEDQMREIADMAHSLRSSQGPQEAMTKQAEFVRKSFETAVKNAGEVAQIAQKSGTDSLEILRNRIRDSMQEIHQLYDKNK